MENDLKNTFDAILRQVTTGKPRVPGVVAMVTDRTANIYEGAGGLRCGSLLRGRSYKAS